MGKARAMREHVRAGKRFRRSPEYDGWWYWGIEQKVGDQFNNGRAEYVAFVYSGELIGDWITLTARSSDDVAFSCLKAVGSSATWEVYPLRLDLPLAANLVTCG